MKLRNCPPDERFHILVRFFKGYGASIRQAEHFATQILPYAELDVRHAEFNLETRRLRLILKGR